jgi:hypothetical protein
MNALCSLCCPLTIFEPVGRFLQNLLGTYGVHVSFIHVVMATWPKRERVLRKKQRHAFGLKTEIAWFDVRLRI